MSYVAFSFIQMYLVLFKKNHITAESENNVNLKFLLKSNTYIIIRFLLCLHVKLKVTILKTQIHQISKLSKTMQSMTGTQTLSILVPRHHHLMGMKVIQQKKLQERVDPKKVVNRKGNIINNKQLIGYHCNCKCYEKFDENIRKTVFEKLWLVSTYNMQNAFICSLIKEYPIKR